MLAVFYSLLLVLQEIVIKTKVRQCTAGDVAQAVVRSPGMYAARVQSSAPHTDKDVVSAEN